MWYIVYDGDLSKRKIDQLGNLIKLIDKSSKNFKINLTI